MKKVIKHGQQIPPGYAIAHLSDYEYAAVCYPWPLNWPIGFFHDVRTRMTHKPLADYEKRIINAIAEKVIEELKKDADFQTNKKLEAWLNESLPAQQKDSKSGQD